MRLPSSTHALWYCASALLNHIFASIHVYQGSLGRKIGLSSRFSWNNWMAMGIRQPFSGLKKNNAMGDVTFRGSSSLSRLRISKSTMKILFAARASSRVCPSRNGSNITDVTAKFSGILIQRRINVGLQPHNLWRAKCTSSRQKFHPAGLPSFLSKISSKSCNDVQGS